ncbi:AMP-dependent synthetase/ligase [Nocardioides cynanchi]|uniref:AMP-dependent synthetase/ligase n=1 Tax=Nocardioides cynanchi TaxID=2558918 RepID=UPI0012443743|nr:AMP-dependent synthetase/ligase [Nocardioides cynanchi]
MSADTLQSDRAEIEQLIGGRTVADALAATVARYGEQPAYSDKADGRSEWRTLTWQQVYDEARDVAAALVDLGVEPGRTVAIMATNRIEHLVADMGAMLAGAVPMSIYNTLSPEQIAFIAGQSRPAVVFVETADHLDRWRTALTADTGVLAVVGIGPGTTEAGFDDDRLTTWDVVVERGRGVGHAAVDARTAALRPEDPATILYTSGTTGDPKGVELSHRNVLYDCEAGLRMSRLEGTNLTVSYLPYAHIAERILSLYIPQHYGDVHIYLVADPSLLLGALGEVHPAQFFGVPRVWEKIQSGVSGLLAMEQDAAKKSAVEEAMRVGAEYVESLQVGHTTSPELQARFEAADAAVLRPIRSMLGLDQVIWAGSASAPMPLEVARFFAGLGMPIYDIWGMTETCGGATACGPDAFKLGTVGRAYPGIELRIADDGELLARGPIMTTGYHQRPEATAELIDADGWLHTGDIASIDDEGFVSIVDRKKELIITSAGKNIAPSNIESYLKESPIVGHALAFGDSRPYVVAVLTLDGEVAPVIAQMGGIEFTDLADLAAKPEILAMAQDAVDKANARLSRPEQIKAFELLPVEWTAESEELTPTLKLKRRVVHTKYADVIDRLYG